MTLNFSFTFLLHIQYGIANVCGGLITGEITPLNHYYVLFIGASSLTEVAAYSLYCLVIFFNYIHVEIKRIGIVSMRMFSKSLTGVFLLCNFIIVKMILPFA